MPPDKTIKPILKMKTLLPLLLTTLLFSSCSQKVYRSLDWQSSKVTADGWIIEWPDQLRFIDNKTKLSYDISNDRRNLYVCMSVADPATKMKILHAGMEFRIDTLGKTKFPMAFVFPSANQVVMARQPKPGSLHEAGQDKGTTHSGQKMKIVSPATEAELVGFKPPCNGTISLLSNTCGISAAINIDSLEVLLYEAIIPFATFYKSELTQADTARLFNYEIRINAMPEPQAREGGAGRGMGASMGGGMGGGHHSGGGGQHSSMGGGGPHGGGHRENGGNAALNPDLYTTSKITNEMKFSVR